MRTEKHPCGCVAERDRQRWVKLCDRHQAEVNEVHQRWAGERAAMREAGQAVTS